MGLERVGTMNAVTNTTVFIERDNIPAFYDERNTGGTKQSDPFIL